VRSGSIPINHQLACAHNVVIHPIGIFLAFDWDGDVQALKQVLFAVLKYAPNVIHRTATSLATSLVEPNMEGTHMISAAGIGQAA